MIFDDVIRDEKILIEKEEKLSKEKKLKLYKS